MLYVLNKMNITKYSHSNLEHISTNWEIMVYYKIWLYLGDIWQILDFFSFGDSKMGDVLWIKGTQRNSSLHFGILCHMNAA